MPRKRFLSPEFFTHAELFDAEAASGLPLRLAFAALWTQCDRRGIFLWKPRELKLACLPYDAVDFADVLETLVLHDFVRPYTVNGRRYGHISSFPRWQSFHKDERPSDAPDPSEGEASTVATPCQHGADPVLTMQSHGSSTPTSITTTTSITTASATKARRGAARSEVPVGEPRTPPFAFPHKSHHDAAVGYWRAHQFPDAFAATLTAMAEGMHGPAVPWETIGFALVEMQGAGARFSPATLRAFVRRLQDTPAGKPLTWDDLMVPTEVRDVA